MRSTDGEHWTRQPDYLLATPGRAETDRAKGQHPDVIVAGDRAYIVYFVQQSGEPQSTRDPEWPRRSALQIAELKEAGGILTVDRDAPTEIRLVRR
jgi:hypothetical protein